MVEESSAAEESRKGVEGADITHGPAIEGQFTRSSVAVEEIETAHWLEIGVQSPDSAIVAEDSPAEESREGSAGVELTREVREDQGQEIHVQLSESSAEESTEAVEVGEIVRMPEFESHFLAMSVVVEESSAEEGRKGVEEAEITHMLQIEGQITKSSVAVGEVETAHWPEIGVQSPNSAIVAEDSSTKESGEGLAGVELVREGIEGQGQELHTQSSESSAEESREGMEQAEITQGPEIERLFAKSSVAVEESENVIQSPESLIVAEGSSAEESREGVEEIEIACGLESETQFAGMVEETKTVHVPETEDQFTKSSVMTEKSLSEESREGMEEAEISQRPQIDAQFTESLVMVEEAKIGHGRGSKAESLGSTIVAEVSLAEESREEEVVEDTELEYGERIESSRNEVEEVPSADCSSSAISSVPSANPRILSVGTDLETRQESQSSLTGDTAQESCRIWLTRGNKAYAKDHFSEAESFYTRAVNFAFEIHPSGRCIQALTLCHSNRAATRMYLGRMRDAIGDCEIALSIDPNFLRARVRMANCYLALGDIESAMNNYKECFQSEKDTSSGQNKKILCEASDGLKKAQQVGDCMNRSMELLHSRTKADAMKALGIISEAMSISTHSESLLEIKAECLCLVGKYEEIFQICKQNVSEDELWRWRVLSMTYFYLGRLEQALELIHKHENRKPLTDKFGSMFPKTSTALSVVIRGLLDLQAAGNAAFHARKFSDAAVHYTAALALSVESRRFAAICLCSRAAAYQELGRVTDAISDCCLAITLDSRNLEVISKRATLYELIGDYEQSAIDLKLLISILGNRLKDQGPMFDFFKGLSNIQSDMEQARLRLCTLEEKARKETHKDLYMILGVARGSSTTDMKNAYRRAALKHHPDKSGMLFITSENVNEGLWKEIANQVHSDAERIFKLIGEAYDILSDASKRQKYEEKEEELMMKTHNIYAHRSSKGYEQSRNTRHAHQSDPRTGNEGYGYGFNQGDEHTRDSGYAHRSDPNAGFNQGYAYNRNSGYTHNKNSGYAHRSDPNDSFNQGYEHSRNSGYVHMNSPEYAHRSDPSAGFNQGYEHSRNSRYGHRGGPRAGNPGYVHRDDHRRRYSQFNYEDLDAQYEQQGQQWDYRRRNDRR